MKNIRRILALALALCLALSMTTFASAAEADRSGTVGDSTVTWTFYPDNGHLIISGKGGTEPFTSEADQPWAGFRDQIKEVWFYDTEDLSISSLAYWFTDCTALKQAEVPYTTPVIGAKAFAGCAALERVLFYYQDADEFRITPGAFAACGSAELTLLADTDQFQVVSRLKDYDWAEDGRTSVRFANVYAPSRLAIWVDNSGYFGTYYCSTCGQALGLAHDLQDNGGGFHARMWACFNASCAMYVNGGALGVWQYMLQEDHVYNSTGTCVYCGYYDASQAQCTHGSYTYSYSYYSAGYHTYTQTCLYCGETISSSLLAHSYSISYSQYSSSQHMVSQTCTGCGYSTAGYAAHTDGNSDGKCDSCAYAMAVFSVTVPAVLPLVMAENGKIHTTAASIVNRSTAAVKVTGVTISAQNGWSLIPYATNMARAKVDSKLVGFALNGVQTTAEGASQALALSENWTISQGGSLTLDYDAVVTAMSEVVTNESILSVVFTLEWA